MKSRVVLEAWDRQRYLDPANHADGSALADLTDGREAEEPRPEDQAEPGNRPLPGHRTLFPSPAS
jgi:hypothetical protein